MSEVNYYQDGTVSVTNARAVLGDKTYAMANITSVSAGEIPPKRMPGIVVAAIGGIIFVCSASMAALAASVEDGSGAGIAGIIFGLLIIGVGIWLAATAKTFYAVKIGTAGNEADGLKSRDKLYIQKIVNAMNEAIVNRG